MNVSSRRRQAKFAISVRFFSAIFAVVGFVTGLIANYGWRAKLPTHNCSAIFYFYNVL